MHMEYEPVYESYRVRETLLSRRPRRNSLRVAAGFVAVIVGMSVLGWLNGRALLPEFAASQGSLQGHAYWQLVTAVAVHSDLQHLLSTSSSWRCSAICCMGISGSGSSPPWE